jgi:hypothetical protein
VTLTAAITVVVVVVIAIIIIVVIFRQLWRTMHFNLQRCTVNWSHFIAQGSPVSVEFVTSVADRKESYSKLIADKGFITVA